jgi:serine/threonine protein kinase
VPDYEVITHLSRSLVLDVYEVWSEERACRCVAKVLRPDFADNRKFRSGLLREGRILKRLTHLHIVRAYEVLEEPQPVVILETLIGSTLEYLIDARRRRLPLSEVVFLGLHLCSAMHYLHRQGLLHRDLKPANIVSNLGLAKVLDLSIARRPGWSRGGAGTPPYMSPEQARGGLLSEATDVWGIGAVLFHAATGRPPFEANEAGQEYQQLQRRADPVRAHRRVPAAFGTVVDSCLDPDPSRRPTVDELTELLNDLVDQP